MESKVYVLNQNDSELEFYKNLDAKNYDVIMNEAERLGTVYSLQGFQNAINTDDVMLDNSFIYIS